ncbi:MAG TPA: cupin domain-containing protein [Blastocatellia bacterium]|nr:cupin domain-containing protein [Blastocatellia bacterium]
MAKRSLSDQLDQALESVMVERDKQQTSIDPRLAELLEIASSLRDLPRQEFKERLEADLRKKAEAAGGQPEAPVQLQQTATGTEIVAHDLRAALGSVAELNIGPATTGEEADAAFKRLGMLNQCTLAVGRFTGLTPWERHPNGDELLHVLDGEVDVTVLTDAGPVVTTVRGGSIFVCPRGLWHRQFSRHGVTTLYATPMPSEISFADDPRLAS